VDSSVGDVVEHGPWGKHRRYLVGCSRPFTGPRGKFFAFCMREKKNFQ
jgi:hypothetical protein